MRLETFINYKNYRWLWISVCTSIVAILGYLLIQPAQGPGGSTFIGYTYGTIAALVIFYLTWFGIRKRSYHSSKGSLKGALSAHIWLGVSLVLLVPLHAGFSFGCNIHTLTYVLMVVVVLSGIWGAVQYARLPTEIRSHRGGATVKKLIEDFERGLAEIRASGEGKSDNFLRLIKSVECSERPTVFRALFGAPPGELSSEELAARVSDLAADEHDTGLKLVALAKRNREIARMLFDEVATLTKLRIWLYIHIPVTVALIGALLVHIFSVFYFF